MKTLIENYTNLAIEFVKLGKKTRVTPGHNDLEPLVKSLSKKDTNFNVRIYFDNTYDYWDIYFYFDGKEIVSVTPKKIEIPNSPDVEELNIILETSRNILKLLQNNELAVKKYFNHKRKEEINEKKKEINKLRIETF